MSQKNNWISCLIPLVLLSVLTSSTKQPVLASLPEPTSFPGALPTLTQSAFYVVRAYYQDRQMVNDLARWLEPWEVHHDLGYLVVGVDQQQLDRLLAMGFRLEIDWELTQSFNQPHLALPGQTSGIPNYPCYRTVEETLATIDSLVSGYPMLASKIDIGDSWDKTFVDSYPGYDLVVLKLTNSSIVESKPKLFLMGSIHAREYAPAELITRFAEHLLTNYNLDADITWLLDYNEIHFLLIANPDGRKYAEIGYPWRKNTNQNYCSPDSYYRGADLNRNFSFQWGCCNGSSIIPCETTYRGPEAASEPETQAIQNYIRLEFPDQRGPLLTDPAPDTASGVFLDIHSYSELVLWPWGFTETLPPNSTALQTLGRKFAYFNLYFPDQAIGLYTTDGSTDDFAYGELGIAAYTFELGTAFFQNCDYFQDIIVPYNIPALVYAAKAARTPYLTPAGPDVTNLPTLFQAEAGTGALLTAVINDMRYSNANDNEPTQDIAAAEYYVDTPPWSTTPLPAAFAMNAADGAFDREFEVVSATLDTSLLSVGRHTIYVRGQDADGNWGAVSAVFLQVTPPVYQVSLSPTSSLQFGLAGEAITHTLSITNTGNPADTYTITLDSAWTATILTPDGMLPSGSSFILAGGQSIVLEIVFYAPEQANPGDLNIAQVTLLSQGDPSLSLTAELTSGIWWRTFLPMLE